MASVVATCAQAQYGPDRNDPQGQSSPDPQYGPEQGGQYPDQGQQYPQGGRYPPPPQQYPPPGGQYPPPSQYPQQGQQYPGGPYPGPQYPGPQYPGPQYPPRPYPGQPYPGPQGGNPPAQSGPEQGAARISMMRGQASVQRGDSGDWSAAALNAPMMAGDGISVGDDSRAEVQLDFADVLRLGDRSRARIATLTPANVQVQIAAGIATYTAFPDGEASIEIDTPNLAIHPVGKEGIYRVQVNSDTDSVVIVRRGEVEVSTPSGSTRVRNGQMIAVRGAGADAQYQIADAPAKDGWDQWNVDRDHVIRNAESWGHTNRYYTGSEDLDAYGRWTTVPDYGPVWVPSVGPGWVPYRAGTWVWEPYWGWTWVSYEPWGWAPYHYGRWFLWGGSWAWWPGPVVGVGIYRPIWAPAYVSFFGFGGPGLAVGVSFGGFGAFGWLPLGPCDRFYPWWGPYRGHFGSVAFNEFGRFNGGRWGGFAPLHGGDRFSNVRLAMHDEHMRGAFSTVPAGRFGQGRVSAIPVSREMLGRAHAFTGNVPVAPTRASLSASGRAANPSTIRGGSSGRFFGSAGHAAAAPQSFERQAAQVHESIQRDGRFGGQNTSRTTSGYGAREPMSSGANRTPGGEPGGRPSARISTPSVPSRGGGAGTSRESAGVAGSRSASGAGSSNSGSSGDSGWQRFGSYPGGSRPGTTTQQPRSTAPAPSTRSQSSGGYGYGRSAYGNGGYSGYGSPYGRSGYGSGGYGGYSRPPLNMSKPIVTPRSYGSPGARSYPSGGYRGAPSGGSHSAPSGGGHSPSGGHSSTSGHSR